MMGLYCKRTDLHGWVHEKKRKIPLRSLTIFLFFCTASDALTMLKIALTLAQFRPAYEETAIKFLGKFFSISPPLFFLISYFRAFYFGG